MVEVTREMIETHGLMFFQTQAPDHHQSGALHHRVPSATAEPAQGNGQVCTCTHVCDQYARVHVHTCLCVCARTHPPTHTHTHTPHRTRTHALLRSLIKLCPPPPHAHARTLTHKLSTARCNVALGPLDFGANFLFSCPRGAAMPTAAAG